MITLKRIFLFLIISFFFISSDGFSQDSLKFNHKSIGIGSTLYSSRFYFPIYLSESIKIEPEWSYSVFKRTDDDVRSTYVEFGTGIFYILDYKQLIPYFGLRFGYNFSKNDYGSDDNNKLSGYYISPTIGAEYFLMERFSIGVELSTEYNHQVGTEKLLGDEKNIKWTGLGTNTFLIMRAYLF